jgi:hypothetical protein
MKRVVQYPSSKTKGATMVDKIPITFQFGDKTIDAATVKSIGFAKFADYIQQARQLKDQKTFEAKLKRVRLQQQVEYHMNGTIVPLALEDVLRLPIPAVRSIDHHLDDNEGPPGKIIREGDGIDVAIAYELGKPIPTGQGKPPIAELEFIAKTYGDIEDVLAATDSIEQTSYLIKTVAKPVHSSLTALPSWAIDQISIADGITIAQKILPIFLGQETV